MCIALLLATSLVGLVLGGVYALYFEGGVRAFLIAYWAGGTISFLAMSLTLLLRGDRASDDTGMLSSLEGHLAVNTHRLDVDEQVLSRENFGSHGIASEGRIRIGLVPTKRPVDFASGLSETEDSVSGFPPFGFRASLSTFAPVSGSVGRLTKTPSPRPSFSTTSWR